MMNTLKKVLFANLVGVFGLMSVISAAPVSAETGSSAAPLNAAIKAFRDARGVDTRENKDGRNVEKRKEVLKKIVEVFKQRDQMHRNLSCDSDVENHVRDNDGKLKSIMNMLDSSRDTQALKAVAKKIEDLRKNDDRGRLVLGCFANKISKAVQHAEERIQKIEAVLIKLGDDGRSVDALKTQLQDARVKLADVRAKIDAAKAQIKAGGDVRPEAFKATLEEIANGVKSVLKMLEDIIAQIRAMSPTTVPVPTTGTSNSGSINQ